MSKGFPLRLFKLLVLVGVPLLGFIYAYQFKSPQGEVQVPFQTFQAPSTTVFTANAKEPKTLNWNKNPITVVNFWATWCPPCLEEFPSMIELQRQLETKGVEFLFISVDDSWSKVEKFLSDNAIDVRADRLFWDPKKNAAQVWGSEKFPETFIIRRDSWVLEKVVGSQRWTRPAVIEYFSDLAQKSQNIVAQNNLIDWIFPSIYADDSNDIPLIHEEDKKSLENLRQNIEVASKNLIQAEAALKSEKRSLEELEVLKNKADSELNEAKNQKSELETKRVELEKLTKKNQSSLDNEQREKKNVENQIKDSQREIERLEKALDAEKVKLVEIQKALATRVQNISSLEKAKESLDEDTTKLVERLKGSNSLVSDKSKTTSEVSKNLSQRKSSVSDLESKVKGFEKTLQQQKKKLVDFENLLKK